MPKKVPGPIAWCVFSSVDRKLPRTWRGTSGHGRTRQGLDPVHLPD